MSTDNINSAAKWFEHSFNLHSTPLGKNIRRLYGWEGYGLLIGLFETLTGEPERKLKLESLGDIAYDFRFDDVDEIKTLKSIIEVYFQNDGECFWSDDLNKMLERYDERIRKASEGGKKASANMTDEQKQARSKKGTDALWGKNNERADQMLTPLASDAYPLSKNAYQYNTLHNNTIEKNTIENIKEQNKTEKNNKGNHKIEENEYLEDSIDSLFSKTENSNDLDISNTSNNSNIPNNKSSNSNNSNIPRNKSNSSSFFNDAGTQKLNDLYPIESYLYNHMTFSEFDEMMLISQIQKILNQGNPEPKDNLELQKYNGLLELDDFGIYREFYYNKADNPEFDNQLKDYKTKYSKN